LFKKVASQSPRIAEQASLEGLKLRQINDNYIRQLISLLLFHPSAADPELISVFDEMPTFVYSDHANWEGDLQ